MGPSFKKIYMPISILEKVVCKIKSNRSMFTSSIDNIQLKTWSLLNMYVSINTTPNPSCVQTDETVIGGFWNQFINRHFEAG